MNEATTHFICTTCGKEWDRPHGATICPGCRGTLAPARPGAAHIPERHAASAPDGTFRRVSGVIGIIIGTITAVTILNESYINYVRFGVEINSLKQQVSDLRDKLAAKPAGPEDLQKELTAQKEAASGLNRQLMQATQQAESSRFAADQAKSQLVVAQATADAVQRENSKLARQVDDRSADIKDLNQRVEALNVKLVTAGTGSGNKELENKVAKLTQDLDAAKARETRAEQDAASSAAEVKSLNTKLLGAQGDMQQLKGAAEIASGKMDQMKVDEAALSDQVKKLTASRDDAMAQLDKMMHPPSKPHIGTMTDAKWKMLVDKMKTIKRTMTSVEVLNLLGPYDDKSESKWFYYDVNGKEYTVTFDINAKPLKGINPPL